MGSRNNDLHTLANQYARVVVVQLNGARICMAMGMSREIASAIGIQYPIPNVMKHDIGQARCQQNCDLEYSSATDIPIGMDC